MSGVYGYVGVTESGKTTLALEHLNLDIATTDFPALILDCMPAKNLSHLPHEPAPDAVYHKLFNLRESAVYTPKSVEEISEIFMMLHVAGTSQKLPVHVLWDEPVVTLDDGQVPMSVYKIDGRIAKALRGWQHNGCSFRLCSQSIKDFHGVFFMCMPEVYVFRLEREPDLDRVELMLKMPRQVIESLPQGKCEVYFRNRFKKVDHAEAPQAPAPQPPAAPPARVDEDVVRPAGRAEGEAGDHDQGDGRQPG